MAHEETPQAINVDVTVQVEQVTLQRGGLLRSRRAEGGAMGQAYPCMLPGMRQSYSPGHVDAVV